MHTCAILYFTVSNYIQFIFKKGHIAHIQRFQKCTVLKKKIKLVHLEHTRRTYPYSAQIMKKKQSSIDGPYPHKSRVTEDFGCLLKMGFRSRINNASWMNRRVLHEGDLMVNVLSTWCLRVNLVLWRRAMWSCGASSLICIVSRLDNDMVVAPM